VKLIRRFFGTASAFLLAFEAAAAPVRVGVDAVAAIRRRWALRAPTIPPGRRERRSRRPTSSSMISESQALHTISISFSQRNEAGGEKMEVWAEDLAISSRSLLSSTILPAILLGVPEVIRKAGGAGGSGWHTEQQRAGLWLITWLKILRRLARRQPASHACLTSIATCLFFASLLRRRTRTSAGCWSRPARPACCNASVADLGSP
jgi:hypothetical protein